MRTVKSPMPWLFSLLVGLGVSAPSAAAEPSRAVVQDCAFRLDTRTRPGTRPPLTDVVLVREEAGCAWGGGELWLGTSYDGSGGTLVASEAGLAVGFTVKGTPSGSAAVFLHLRHVAPQSLSVVRATSLGALRPFASASVYVDALSLLGNGTSLEVRGTKSGVIPGELGEGEVYRATYPDFFTGSEPPAVEAWSSPGEP